MNGLSWVMSFVIVLFWVFHTGAAEDDDEVSYLGFHNVATMPYNLSDNTATTFDIEFDDNHGPRIYLVGGCDSSQQCVFVNETVNDAIFCYCPSVTNRCMYFTPETETWHTDCAPAPTPRYRHMAAKVGNYLFVAGGRRQSDDSIITSIERYDPIADEWTNPFNWTDASSDGAAFGSGDWLYLVGGYDSTYNTLASLTAIHTLTGEMNSTLPGMNVSRGDLAAIAATENEIFVVGGWNDPTFCVPASVVEIYSINTSSWRTAPSLNHSRGDLVLGVLGDAVFAVGGENRVRGDSTCTYSDPVNLVERYLQHNAAWDDEEDIPSDLFRFSGTSYTSRSSNKDFITAIYLFGGQSTYNAETMSFPLKGSTIKYIPESTRRRHSKKLTSGSLAGVIIGGFIAGLIVILIFLIYLEHRRRDYNKLPPSEGSSLDTVDPETALKSSTGNIYVKLHDKTNDKTRYRYPSASVSGDKSSSTSGVRSASNTSTDVGKSSDTSVARGLTAGTATSANSSATVCINTGDGFVGGVIVSADGKRAFSHAPKPRKIESIEQAAATASIAV